jgi:hypothetical protein
MWQLNHRLHFHPLHQSSSMAMMHVRVAMVALNAPSFSRALAFDSHKALDLYLLDWRL